MERQRSFVIFWFDWDLYKQSFLDVRLLNNVQYIERPLIYLTKFHRRLYDFMHCEHKGIMNTIYKLLKIIIPNNYWLRFYFDRKKISLKKNVFIFPGAWRLLYNDMLPCLKKGFPKAKFVLFLCDLYNNYNTEEDANIDDDRKYFDLILSFDQEDCKKYGFTYHPLVFSPYRGVIKDMPQYDIYFLGQPKNRYKELISCFEKFWEHGLTTDICLVGVKPEEQVYKDKIQYSDSFISYEENLQRTIHAKCELEIMQKGGTGYTQRMCEVIALDKKIVTNNPLIHEAPFFNPEYIFQIKSADDITKEICEKIKRGDKVDYNYKEKISPVELLEFIEKRV